MARIVDELTRFCDRYNKQISYRVHGRQSGLSVHLPIFYAFARSGGTLINRCLGSIPGNIVLSEVNPYYSVISVEKQAKDWFSLISDTEYESLLGHSYIHKVQHLAMAASASGKKLIIRDWVTVNFLADVLGNGLFVSSGLLEQEIYLTHYGFVTHPIVISRYSADVYDSVIRTFKQFQSLSVKDFGTAYLEYAKSVFQYPIFHYEDICREPETYIEKICKVLDINYDPSFQNTFFEFEACTGDTRQPQVSRGKYMKTIAPLSSNTDSEAYIAALQDENCKQADKLLGYVY